MNESMMRVNTTHGSAESYAVVGLASPEFRAFIKDLVMAIGAATKSAAKKFYVGARKVLSWLAEQNRIALQTHDYVVHQRDEFYSRNMNCIRGGL